MQLDEALVVLFKGQMNVAKMAKKLDMPLKTLQEEFRQYVAKTPIDEDVWKGDILITWPFIT